MTFYCPATKAALFSHLMARWRDLFNANFDVLLYDLTQKYLRRDQRVGRGGEGDKRRHGYSRDKRPDCPAGGDCAGGHPGRSAVGLRGAARQHGGLQDALRMFLAKIEQQYWPRAARLE